MRLITITSNARSLKPYINSDFSGIRVLSLQLTLRFNLIVILVRPGSRYIPQHNGCGITTYRRICDYIIKLNKVKCSQRLI